MNKTKLMVLLHTSGWNIFTNPVSANIEQIADYLDKNGVIVLPCKVGTPVFIINKKGRIFCGKFRLDDIDQFGKRVFLTRAEAEAVLNARCGK